MNCYKSFNVSKQYGTIRLTILSLMGTIFFFTIFYSLFGSNHHKTAFSSFNLLTLIMTIFIVWPVHKSMHCLPLWLAGKRASISIERSINNGIPMIYTNIPGTISKHLSIIMVSFPSVIITVVIFASAFKFPSMVYYLSLAGALNFGLCMKDFVYLVHLTKAPANALIEDDRDGCKILIKQAY